MKLQLLALFALVAIVSARRRGHLKKKCRYDRGNWGECDTATNQVTMTLTLKPESPETCAPTHVKTITCDQLKKWQEKKSKLAEHVEEKKKWKLHKKTIKEKYGMGCKYEIKVSDCDPETNLVTKTFTPMSVDTTVCTMETISYSCHLHEKLMSWKAKRQNRKGKKNKLFKKKERKQRRKNRRQEKTN